MAVFLTKFRKRLTPSRRQAEILEEAKDLMHQIDHRLHVAAMVKFSMVGLSKTSQDMHLSMYLIEMGIMKCVTRAMHAHGGNRRIQSLGTEIINTLFDLGGEESKAVCEEIIDELDNFVTNLETNADDDDVAKRLELILKMIEASQAVAEMITKGKGLKVLTGMIANKTNTIAKSAVSALSKLMAQVDEEGLKRIGQLVMETETGSKILDLIANAESGENFSDSPREALSVLDMAVKYHPDVGRRLIKNGAINVVSKLQERGYNTIVPQHGCMVQNLISRLAQLIEGDKFSEVTNAFKVLDSADSSLAEMAMAMTSLSEAVAVQDFASIIMPEENIMNKIVAKLNESIDFQGTDVAAKESHDELSSSAVTFISRLTKNEAHHEKLLKTNAVLAMSDILANSSNDYATEQGARLFDQLLTSEKSAPLIKEMGIVQKLIAALENQHSDASEQAKAGLALKLVNYADGDNVKTLVKAMLERMRKDNHGSAQATHVQVLMALYSSHATEVVEEMKQNDGMEVFTNIIKQEVEDMENSKEASDTTSMALLMTQALADVGTDEQKDQAAEVVAICATAHVGNEAVSKMCNATMTKLATNDALGRTVRKVEKELAGLTENATEEEKEQREEALLTQMATLSSMGNLVETKEQQIQYVQVMQKVISHGQLKDFYVKEFAVVGLHQLLANQTEDCIDVEQVMAELKVADTLFSHAAAAENEHCIAMAYAIVESLIQSGVVTYDSVLAGGNSENLVKTMQSNLDNNEVLSAGQGMHTEHMLLVLGRGVEDEVRLVMAAGSAEILGALIMKPNQEEVEVEQAMNIVTVATGFSDVTTILMEEKGDLIHAVMRAMKLTESEDLFATGLQIIKAIQTTEEQREQVTSSIMKLLADVYDNEVFVKNLLDFLAEDMVQAVQNDQQDVLDLYDMDLIADIQNRYAGVDGIADVAAQIIAVLEAEPEELEMDDALMADAPVDAADAPADAAADAADAVDMLNLIVALDTSKAMSLEVTQSVTKTVLKSTQHLDMKEKDNQDLFVNALQGVNKFMSIANEKQIKKEKKKKMREENKEEKDRTRASRDVQPADPSEEKQSEAQEEEVIEYTLEDVTVEMISDMVEADFYKEKEVVQEEMATLIDHLSQANLQTANMSKAVKTKFAKTMVEMASNCPGGATATSMAAAKMLTTVCDSAMIEEVAEEVALQLPSVLQAIKAVHLGPAASEVNRTDYLASMEIVLHAVAKHDASGAMHTDETFKTINEIMEHDFKTDSHLGASLIISLAANTAATQAVDPDEKSWSFVDKLCEQNKAANNTRALVAMLASVQAGRKFEDADVRVRIAVLLLCQMLVKSNTSQEVVKKMPNGLSVLLFGVCLLLDYPDGEQLISLLGLRALTALVVQRDSEMMGKLIAVGTGSFLVSTMKLFSHNLPLVNQAFKVVARLAECEDKEKLHLLWAEGPLQMIAEMLELHANTNLDFLHDVCITITHLCDNEAAMMLMIKTRWHELIERLIRENLENENVVVELSPILSSIYVGLQGIASAQGSVSMSNVTAKSMLSLAENLRGKYPVEAILKSSIKILACVSAILDLRSILTDEDLKKWVDWCAAACKGLLSYRQEALLAAWSLTKGLVGIKGFDKLCDGLGTLLHDETDSDVVVVAGAVLLNLLIGACKRKDTGATAMDAGMALSGTRALKRHHDQKQAVLSILRCLELMPSCSAPLKVQLKDAGCPDACDAISESTTDEEIVSHCKYVKTAVVSFADKVHARKIFNQEIEYMSKADMAKLLKGWDCTKYQKKAGPKVVHFSMSPEENAVTYNSRAYHKNDVNKNVIPLQNVNEIKPGKCTPQLQRKRLGFACCKDYSTALAIFHSGVKSLSLSFASMQERDETLRLLRLAVNSFKKNQSAGLSVGIVM